MNAVVRYSRFLAFLFLASCSSGEPSVEVLIERAHLLERQERLPEAVETYNRILKIDPQRASVYYDRGVAYDSLGNFDAAFADYSKTIELDKGFFRAFNNRAVLQSRRGEFAAAVKDCDETLLLNPQDSLAFRNRGFALLQLKRFDDSLKDFDNSIRIDGKSPMSYVLRGQAYQTLERNDRALEDFLQAISLDPKLAQAYYSRAVSLAKLEKLEEARQDLETALRMDSQIVVAPDLAVLLKNGPKSSSNTGVSAAKPPPAAEIEVSEMEFRRAAVEYAKTVLLKKGLEVSDSPNLDDWSLNYKTSEGKPAIARILVTDGNISEGIPIPASTVEQLRAQPAQVLLLILKRSVHQNPSESPAFEVLAEDDAWLSDPDRLKPSQFVYLPSEKQLTSTQAK